MSRLTEKEANLCLEYKRRLEELSHVIKLNKKLKYLNLAWEQYQCLLKEIKSEVANNPKLIFDEYYTRSIEMVVTNLLSVINETRECLKVKFVEATSDRITNTLVTQYASKQSAYDRLLNKTIEQDNLYKWANALRNILLHSGSMMFGFCHFTGNILVNGRLTSCTSTYIVCDYELLDKDEKFKSLPLETFYLDEAVFLLKLIYHGQYKLDWLTNDQMSFLDNELNTRTGKQVKLRELSSQELDLLLKDKAFLLYYYNEWKKKNIPSQGTFTFNLTQLIEQIFNAHKELYEGLYNLVCTCENDKLKQLMALADEIEKLNADKRGVLSFSKVNFSLKCEKNKN